jgi:hypothetical protein
LLAVTSLLHRRYRYFRGIDAEFCSDNRSHLTLRSTIGAAAKLTVKGDRFQKAEDCTPAPPFARHSALGRLSGRQNFGLAATPPRPAAPHARASVKLGKTKGSKPKA